MNISELDVFNVHILLSKLLFLLFNFIFNSFLLYQLNTWAERYESNFMSPY